MMPNTVNIERHKLNQAMYQKLKRYIMSKRRRELEEKAQDAHFKRLRKEREERRRQAEVDAENLEETRGELSATRKKIRELTARRNELFQRWKQLRSEESTLKEKRKNEASAILANIPSTQFGINPGAVGNPNRNMTATNPPLSNTTTHVQSSQPAHMQPGKTFTIGPNAITPCLTLPPQQHGHSHLSNSTASQDISSTLRGLQNVAYTTSVSKSSQLPLTSPSTLGTGLLQVPCTSISTSHAAAMAAVVAALTAQPRTGNSTDSVFSTTAAAAAYLNAIASLTSNSATSVPLFASNPMGILTPNSVTFSDTVDALTASGLCSLSVPNNISTSTYASTTGAISRAQNASIGHRSSPLLTPLDGSIFKDGDFRSVQAAAAAVVAAFAQQSAALSKSFPVNQRHSISGTEREAIAMDPSATCLAQIGAALGVTSGPLHPQKSQPSPQLMCSLNVVNPMLANFGGVLPLDTSVGAVVSTSTTTAVTNVSGPSLPPAPISYRGSITTGQSAQQIQLQQHQKQQQQQQHHIMTKYQPPSEFATTRGTSQQADVISHATPASAQITNRSSALNHGRPGDVAAFMSSIGVTNSSSTLLNADALYSAISSATISGANSLSSSTSPLALTAVLAAPYAGEQNHFNYLTTATLAAAFQQQHHHQQQQMQKLGIQPGNFSPLPRTSQASANSSASNTPTVNSSGPRHFF